MPLPSPRVNKGKTKGRGVAVPALFILYAAGVSENAAWKLFGKYQALANRLTMTRVIAA